MAQYHFEDEPLETFEPGKRVVLLKAQRAHNLSSLRTAGYLIHALAEREDGTIIAWELFFTSQNAANHYLRTLAFEMPGLHGDQIGQVNRYWGRRDYGRILDIAR